MPAATESPDTAVEQNLLRLMIDAAAAVNRAGPLERALREVAAVCARTGWDACTILRRAASGEQGWLGTRGSDDRALGERIGTQIGARTLRRIIERGEPVWLEKLDGRGPFTNAFLVPIASEDEVFGLLVLASRRARPASARRLESEVLVHIAALLGLRLERRALERQMAQVTEKERRTIGHELHDVLGQELTGLAMLAGALERELRRERRPQAESAAQMAEIVRSAQGNLRSLIRGLVPVVVDASGLMAALAELARETSEIHRLDCRFESTPTLDLHDNLTATHLYLIALEAVHNAVRHGQPERIRISLEAEPESLTLTVEDDGRGMRAPAEAPEKGKRTGQGLRILRYRAGLLDAELEIDSAPGRGTTVRCEVPLAGDEAGKDDGDGGGSEP